MKLVGNGKNLISSRLVSLGGAKQDVFRDLPVPLCFSERIPGKEAIGRRSDGGSTTYQQCNATKVPLRLCFSLCSHAHMQVNTKYRKLETH